MCPCVCLLPPSENNRPGYEDCGYVSLDDCNSTQMSVFVDFMATYQSTLAGISQFHSDGNGAYIYSCLTHCAETQAAFNTIKINNVSMQEAMTAWWLSSETPATLHTHLPCTYNTTAVPHRCNPTCAPH